MPFPVVMTHKMAATFATLASIVADLDYYSISLEGVSYSLESTSAPAPPCPPKS